MNSRSQLTHLASALVERVSQTSALLEEGVVRTPGPPPYRRLDVGGRAFCYVRVRPKKQAVRVDVSRLWDLPFPAPEALAAKNPRGLVIRSSADLELATEWLAGLAATCADARTVASG